MARQKDTRKDRYADVATIEEERRANLFTAFKPTRSSYLVLSLNPSTTVM